MIAMLRDKKHSENKQKGFTLLEVIIALAIMTVSIASILAVESGSIRATGRARQINLVAMLLRNKMVETEYKIEGKTFEEVKKEESGTFPSPFEDYSWTSEIKEITFPNLNFGTKSDDPNNANGNSQSLDQYIKLLTNFLSKAIREVTVTVILKEGKGQLKYSAATYWVDLNHEFDLSE